jgi:hypothetical protein
MDWIRIAVWIAVIVSGLAGIVAFVWFGLKGLEKKL